MNSKINFGQFKGHLISSLADTIQGRVTIVATAGANEGEVFDKARMLSYCEWLETLNKDHPKRFPTGHQVHQNIELPKRLACTNTIRERQLPVSPLVSPVSRNSSRRSSHTVEIEVDDLVEAFGLILQIAKARK